MSSYIIRSSRFTEMATFEESFLYPLILLLVGAGVTSLLIPWFTNRWQDRRKQLEIKVDLVSKITEVYGSMSAKVVVSTERMKPISNIDEAWKNFLVTVI